MQCLHSAGLQSSNRLASDGRRTLLLTSEVTLECGYPAASSARRWKRHLGGAESRQPLV